jgi:hypothetical protein
MAYDIAPIRLPHTGITLFPATRSDFSRQEMMPKDYPFGYIEHSAFEVLDGNSRLALDTCPDSLVFVAKVLIHSDRLVGGRTTEENFDKYQWSESEQAEFAAVAEHAQIAQRVRDKTRGI